MPIDQALGVLTTYGPVILSAFLFPWVIIIALMRALFKTLREDAAFKVRLVTQLTRIADRLPRR